MHSIAVVQGAAVIDDVDQNLSTLATLVGEAAERGADVVVTDYSSIMFDLAATDTPVILFTPDLDRYADELRGFYFDVTTDAPGPVVASRDALLDAIDASSSGMLPSQRAAWRERFTPFDDGRAGERVVARILAEGLLD